MMKYIKCSICGATFLGNEADGHYHMQQKHPEVVYVYGE